MASATVSKRLAFAWSTLPSSPTCCAAWVKAAGSRMKTNISTPERPKSFMAAAALSAGSSIPAITRESSVNWSCKDMRERARVLTPKSSSTPLVVTPSSLTPASARWNRAIMGPAASAPMPALASTWRRTTSSLMLAPVDTLRSSSCPPRSSAPLISLKTPLSPAMAARAARKAAVMPAAVACRLRIWR